MNVTPTGLACHPRRARTRDAGHGGVIVNNACVLGWRAQPGQCHYAAAKAGVMAFTRCGAMEAAEHGVRINAVSPSLATHLFLQRPAASTPTDSRAAKPSGARRAVGSRHRHRLPRRDTPAYLTGEVISVSSQHP